MSKEALKLALEALTQWQYSCPQWWDEKDDRAITALREALANEALDKKAENARELGLDYEPAQEPVAWLHPANATCVTTDPSAYLRGIPLYTTPQPAQRTWVGLTNNELQPIADEYRILFGSWVKDFARAIEAKLRSKNEDRN